MIDFRTSHWGHALSAKAGDDGKLHGFCWCTPGPREGDTLTWRTGYGEAVGVFESARWMINVDDMYEVVVRVTERVEVGGCFR